MLRAPEFMTRYGRISGYPVLLAAVAGIGIYLRVYDFFVSPLSLWYDEAWRASNLLSTGGLFNAMIKGNNNIDPVIFNIGVYLLAKIYNTESTLRLISLLPSLLSIWLVYRIARELTNEKWIVFWAVLVVSIHPTLIDYSRELKPYALVLCMHLAVICLYLAFRDTRSTAKIYLFSLFLLISYFVSITTVFLFPGIYVLLLIRHIREKESAAAKAVLISAGILFLCLGAAAYYQIKYVPIGTQVANFGDTFNLKDTFFWYARWAVQHYFEMISHILMPIDLMNVRPVMGFFYIALYVFAIAWLFIDKSYEKLALFFSPILVLLVFNRLGLWPWGFTRTNLFVFGYIILTAICGLDILLSRIDRSRRPLFAGLLVLVLLTQFPYNMEKLEKKSFGRSEIRSSLNYFYEKVKSKKGPIVLIYNAMARPQFKYYAYHHRDFSKKFDSISDRITLMGLESRMPANIRKALPDIYRQHPEYWIVLAHYNEKEKIALTDPKLVDVLEKKKFFGSWAIHVRSKIYAPDSRGRG
ncbi:MAG: glycosyltransferase family 39 protein [Deltaproteobacteria bacterium]|nr:glycosyltransferase family 39 protein [Deltaproteobacteria bacterium]